MANGYKVSLDLSEMLAGMEGIINAYVLPTVHQAVKAVAAETVYRWKDGVAKAKLWDGEKQAYIESINWLMTSDFEAVVSATYDQAEAIETGRPARDLKKMLSTSLKVRMSKKGIRYLIIPMRTNTPGNFALAQAMPPDVYKKAKRLDPSSITGTVSRPSGTGAFSLKTKKPITVPQQQYAWGGKLPAGLAPKLKPHHKTDIYAGMYKFQTSAGKGKSSAYMTFRVMTENSTGWIIPAKPGLYLAKAVQDGIAVDAPRVFEEAIAHLK